MKHISRFLLFLMMLGICAGLSAQVKIATPHKDLKIKVLRCFAQGNSCIIDMLYENAGISDVKFEATGTQYDATAKAYDDMGNVYNTNHKNLVYLYIGDMANNLPGFPTYHTLLSGIPIKVRVQIDGLSEIATEIKRLDFELNLKEPWNINRAKIKILDIPITR